MMLVKMAATQVSFAPLRPSAEVSGSSFPCTSERRVGEGVPVQVRRANEL